MEQRGHYLSPKIIQMIQLHRRYPLQVESRLLEFGIRWRSVGEDPTTTWDDVVAILETDPPWGTVTRAILGSDWIWAIPGYNELVSLIELTAIGNVQRGNQSGAKRSDFPKKVRRPNENREIVDQKKIGKTAVNSQLMAELLFDRMDDSERNQVLHDFAVLI